MKHVKDQIDKAKQNEKVEAVEVVVSRDGTILEKEGNSKLDRDTNKKVAQGKAKNVKGSKVSSSDGARFIPATYQDTKNLHGDGLHSDLHCYRTVSIVLWNKYKIRLSLDTQGGNKLSGHTAYTVSSPDCVAAIDYPDRFKVLKRIKPDRYSMITSRIMDVISDLMEVMGCDDEGTVEGLLVGSDRESPRGNWETNSKEDENTDSKLATKIYARFMRVWAGFEIGNVLAHRCAIALQDEDSSYSCQINSTGNDIAAQKWIPQTEWFNPKLIGISNEQLLSLIPDSEREVMMLFLGRVLNGREGTPHTDGSVQTLKWRSVVLFEGPEAGMGRTTLLEYLSSGLKICGYHSNPINDLAGRFGHGRSANLDFGFVDDLNPEDTIRSLSSAVLKTLSSGGTLSVEEKGEKSYSTTAIGAYMLCTNYLDLTRLTQLDSGNISRLMPMRNASSNDQRSKEYMSKYGYRLNTDVTYLELSKEYGVSINTLILLLLSRCSEMYQSYMGEEQSVIVDRLIELKKTFVIDTGLDHLNRVFDHYAELSVIKTGSKPTLFRIEDYLNLIVKSQGTRINGCSDSADTILEFAKEVIASKRRSSKVMLKDFFDLLVSDNGLGYPSTSDIVTQKYRGYQDQINITETRSGIRELEDCVDCGKQIPDSLKPLSEMLNKLRYSK